MLSKNPLSVFYAFQFMCAEIGKSSALQTPLGALESFTQPDKSSTVQGYGVLNRHVSRLPHSCRIIQMRMHLILDSLLTGIPICWSLNERLRHQNILFSSFFFFFGLNRFGDGAKRKYFSRQTKSTGASVSIQRHPHHLTHNFYLHR